MLDQDANVAVRVDPEIKERAEMVLERFGISAGTAIEPFYRQVVLTNGVPFRPIQRPRARDEMGQAEFDARMAEGLAQAKADMSSSIDEVFARLRQGIPDA